MRLKSLIIWLLTSISANVYASSAFDHQTGPTSNVVKSFLNTIYEGKSQSADSAMDQLTVSYRDFLDEFVYEPYCDDERLTGLYKACEKFRKDEVVQITDNKWSRSYNFNKAEFGNRFTSYNFVKSIPLVDDFLCQITLQVSFDLKSKDLINQEYWAHCD